MIGFLQFFNFVCFPEKLDICNIASKNLLIVKSPLGLIWRTQLN